LTDYVRLFPLGAIDINNQFIVHISFFNSCCKYGLFIQNTRATMVAWFSAKYWEMNLPDFGTIYYM